MYYRITQSGKFAGAASTSHLPQLSNALATLDVPADGSASTAIVNVHQPSQYNAGTTVTLNGGDMPNVGGGVFRTSGSLTPGNSYVVDVTAPYPSLDGRLHVTRSTPGAFTLSAPSGGSTVSAVAMPTISWTRSAGANGYLITGQVLGAGGNPTYTRWTTDTSIVLPLDASITSGSYILSVQATTIAAGPIRRHLTTTRCGVEGYYTHARTYSISAR